MGFRNRLVVAGAGALVVYSGLIGVVVADGIDAGDVKLVNPANPALPVNEGDSYTQFAFKLPDDARCGGDSMHDGWAVNTFLVPVGADLANLEFDGIRPLGSDDYLPMRDISGRKMIGELTGANSEPGQEAVIPQLPPLSFENWDPELFKTGTYSIGIACNEIGQPVERYWDAKVVLIEDPTVERWQRRWELVEEFRGEPETDNFRRNLLIGIAVAASLIFIGISWRGRRTPTPVDGHTDEASNEGALL